MAALNEISPANLMRLVGTPECPAIVDVCINSDCADPNAQFLFVPPDTVDDVATKFGATPFDTQTPPWTHELDLCNFNVMSGAFGLRHEALETLATVVRAADTDRHELSLQAAGLLAISVGLSRMYRDDTAQLDAGMVIYDALYRWARDGQDEGHTWQDAAT